MTEKTKEKMEIANRLIAEGKSKVQAAKEVGISLSTLYNSTRKAKAGRKITTRKAKVGRKVSTKMVTLQVPQEQNVFIAYGRESAILQALASLNGLRG